MSAQGETDAHFVDQFVFSIDYICPVPSAFGLVSLLYVGYSERGLTLGSREFRSLTFNLITVFILIASSGACHESEGQRETDRQTNRETDIERNV